MEMHQIRYFLAVSRVLNFTQAAAECNVSQPALSRAIKQLEDELGGELFRRERSLTHLTDLGRMMQPLLCQAYETAVSAKSLASSYRKGHHAPLRLALSSAVNMRVLVEPLSHLIESLPGVEMKFLRGDAKTVGESLKSGEFELAVAGRLPDGWDRFRSWPLYEERFVLVAHHMHPIVGRNAVRLGDLAGQRLILRPYCEMTNVLTRQLTEKGIHQGSGDSVASEEDVLALIDANVGIAIMPERTPFGPQLRTIAIEDLDLSCTVHLYAVAGRQYSPAAAALIQLLRAADWSRGLSGPKPATAH